MNCLGGEWVWGAGECEVGCERMGSEWEVWCGEWGCGRGVWSGRVRVRG